MAVYNALHRNGIRTYGQLALLTDRELLGLRGFGSSCLADLKAHLATRLRQDLSLPPGLSTALWAQLDGLNEQARRQLPA